jgi:hypothetical protein
MIRHLAQAAVALGLAAPAGAEGLVDQAFCAALWATVQAHAGKAAPVTGAAVTARDGGCEIADLRVDLPGEHTPDWQADRLWLAGTALPWAMGAGGPPDRLDLRVEGLRPSVTTGMAQLDYVLEAQARAQPIAVQVSLAWGDGILTIEDLTVDFPGANLLHLTARIDGLAFGGDPVPPDLAPVRLMAADLRVETHGLFEAYLLSPLASHYLPSEGNVAAAARALRDEAAALALGLPDATFPLASRQALARLIGELPNPAGLLSVSLQADRGLALWAWTDGPADAAAVADGVVVRIDWTPAPAP